MTFYNKKNGIRSSCFNKNWYPYDCKSIEDSFNGDSNFTCCKTSSIDMFFGVI